jgi:intracellular sulfur oxidation DsrE/DsrF family protein
MSTRRDFISATSLLALAPVSVNASPASKTNSPEPNLTFNFDEDQFNRILAKPAKHKQCFGVTKLEDGGPLDGMNNTIEAYEQYLKEPPESVQVVAVLYHGAAIAFALSDAVWNEFIAPAISQAPESVKKDMADIKLGHGNPYLRSTGNDPDEVTVQSLLKKGASFFVCHNAIVGFSYGAAKAKNIGVETAHAAILAGIIPGALAVPAGVMAINACQEARFTYIQSTL